MQKRIHQCYFIITWAVIGFLIYISATYSNEESKSGVNKAYIPFNQGWKECKEDKTTQDIELPLMGKTKAGHIYTIQNQLPETLLEGSVLCFKNDHLLVRVFCEEKEIYSLKADERSTIGKSPGLSYVFIPLLKEYANKTIKIVYQAVYSNSSFHITNIYLGEKSAIILRLLYKNLIPIIISVFTFLLGIVFIIAYFIKKNSYQISKSLLYLGLFSLPFSIWSLVETQTMQFFFFNTYALQYITYLSLGLCPYLFLIYFDERHKTKKTRILNMIGALCCIMIFVCLILQTFGIVELPDTLILVHISIAGVTAYTLFYSIMELMQKKDKTYQVTLSGICMIILLLSTIIDVLRYYFVVNADYAKYVRFGFILYLGSTGLGMIFRTVESDKRQKELERLVYMDEITQTRNRLSLLKDLSELPKVDIGLILVKVVGEGRVHKQYKIDARDMIIRNTARMLERSFQNNGIIYRYQDNCFVVLLTNDIQRLYHIGIEALNKRVYNLNKNREQKIVLEHECVLLTKEEYENLDSMVDYMDMLVETWNKNEKEETENTFSKEKYEV